MSWIGKHLSSLVRGQEIAVAEALGITAYAEALRSGEVSESLRERVMEYAKGIPKDAVSLRYFMATGQVDVHITHGVELPPVPPELTCSVHTGYQDAG